MNNPWEKLGKAVSAQLGLYGIKGGDQAALTAAILSCVDDLVDSLSDAGSI